MASELEQIKSELQDLKSQVKALNDWTRIPSFDIKVESENYPQIRPFDLKPNFTFHSFLKYFSRLFLLYGFLSGLSMLSMLIVDSDLLFESWGKREPSITLGIADTILFARGNMVVFVFYWCAAALTGLFLVMLALHVLVLLGFAARGEQHFDNALRNMRRTFGLAPRVDRRFRE